MDWTNMISVIIGGIIAIFSALLVSSFSAKKERDKFLLEQKINTYLEFTPIVKSLYEADDLKNGVAGSYDIPRIKLLSSKVLLICNTNTRTLINELFITLKKYNMMCVRRDGIEGLSDLDHMGRVVIPNFCERILKFLNMELEQAHKKTYNFQKGFFRLTVIISVLTGILTCIIKYNSWIHPENCWLYGLLGFFAIWFIYGFLRYIIFGWIYLGFTEPEIIKINKTNFFNFIIEILRTKK